MKAEQLWDGWRGSVGSCWRWNEGTSLFWSWLSWINTLLVSMHIVQNHSGLHTCRNKVLSLKYSVEEPLSSSNFGSGVHITVYWVMFTTRTLHVFTSPRRWWFSSGKLGMCVIRASAPCNCSGYWYGANWFGLVVMTEAAAAAAGADCLCKSPLFFSLSKFFSIIFTHLSCVDTTFTSMLFLHFFGPLCLENEIQPQFCVN